MKHVLKKATSLLLSAATIATSFACMVTPQNVEAEQVSGNAPFINTWLVSGPFENPVADQIYGTEVQELKNLAKEAKITVSSTYPNNPIEYICDGTTNHQWVTAENDFEPWVQFDWETPVSINQVKLAQWGDGRHINNYYHLTFTLQDGSVIESGKVDSTSSDPKQPTVYERETLNQVVSMKVEVDKGRTPYPSITGISELEIYNNPAVVPDEDVNLAQKATASSSSFWCQGTQWENKEKDGPQNTIDGNPNTQWVSYIAMDKWETRDQRPTLTLEWDTPVPVGTIEVFDRIPGEGENACDTTEVEVSAYIEGQEDPVTATIKDPTPDVAGKATFAPPLENVTSVELAIIYDQEQDVRNAGLGFSEVNVYASSNTSTDPEEPEPLGDISPVTGEEFGTESEKLPWEYFDDRLWNRSYDDYNDLYGYYHVKQDIDTRNQYVYAHTYVYSPKKQEAQFRVGSSGSYRLYVNDYPVTSPSVPNLVKKDMTKQPIVLQEGWNKLLIQIKHTYTEDLNANGVPDSRDYNVAYLGFYGRITDNSGNKIEGLQYSVSGNVKEGASLQIDTGALKANQDENGKLPEGNMPTGYTEWPYVWNVSTAGNSYGVHATPFQLLASGGKPGYNWEIIEGSLPEGVVLNPDGTFDGFVDDDPGDYPFTVQVTDGEGATAEKELSIHVKERPNKLFEEGRVSALSHCIAIYPFMIDPNFSADLWAERAKRQGHSYVSIEARQPDYYWPSKYVDFDGREKYFPKDENGQLRDGLKEFIDALKRYGIKCGFYWGSDSMDIYAQGVEELIERYDLDYLYFDGPQGHSWNNFDIPFSTVRNYSDEIIMNMNSWGEEYGDVDLRTTEASGYYSKTGATHTTKKTIIEPWKSVLSRNGDSMYYNTRDDYRLLVKEMIANVGRGAVDNNDQMPIFHRGPNYHSPEQMATYYPKNVQEFISIREGTAAWFAPEGKIERHESTTGTVPYYLDGAGCSCDFVNGGRDVRDNHFALGHGPEWGYATTRDENIYLHIVNIPGEKSGFSAIENNQLVISPVSAKVETVSWFNEDTTEKRHTLNFQQDGDKLVIDLTGVKEDVCDTILKITTEFDEAERKYTLTDLYLSGSYAENGSLRIDAEGQMTYPALKCYPELTYRSENPQIASINENGVITAGANGETEITVTGAWKGTEVENKIKVKVTDGYAYIGEDLIGAVMHVNGAESFAELSSYQSYDFALEGRSATGGAVSLEKASITLHSGVVDLKGGDKSNPIKITESDLIDFSGNQMYITKAVKEQTRCAVWADVELNGQKFTTNMVFFDLMPFENLAQKAKISASSSLDSFTPDKLADGILIDGKHADFSRWSVEGSGQPWVEFDLEIPTQIQNVGVIFNTNSGRYVNTPKTITIQTSNDGENWVNVNSQAVPQDTDSNTIILDGVSRNVAYMGSSFNYKAYEVNQTSRYIRLLFPDGGYSSQIDVLEVMINGIDLSDKLATFDATFESIDSTSGQYQIHAYKGNGEEIPADELEIQVESLNPEIISAENNILHGIAAGKAQIRIFVKAGGRTLMQTTYLDSDENGNLSALPYLNEVKLDLTGEYLSKDKPVTGIVDAALSDGSVVDLSRAEVEYIFGDGRVSTVEGSNVIVLKEEVQTGFETTVQAKVTLDGVTVLSEPRKLTVLGTNLATNAKVTVSSIYQDRMADYGGQNAIDSNRTTQWGSRVIRLTDSDLSSPWIRLDFGREVSISEINLVDRGHDVNEIGEGVLEWEGGSQTLTGIKWEGQPDNIFTFDTPLKTSWIKFTIDPENKYLKNDSARGLTEFEVYASEEETVQEIVGFKPLAVDTHAGKTPELPSQVEAIYNDGSIQMKNVVWDDIPEDQLKTEGFFMVEGTVEGTDVKATVTVRVSGELEEAADKTLLQKTYEYALEQDISNLIDSVKAYYEEALSEGKAVLDDANATQAEVDAATDKLLNAVWMLDFVKGDKTNLGMLIERAEGMVANAEKYVQGDIWQELEDALAKAKEVMADGDAMEEDVKPAADALLNAILAQRYKADKSILESLINKVSGMDLSRYTVESVAILKAALAEANLVLADESLSEDDQPVVKAAVQKLESAVKGLKELGDSSIENGKDPDNTPNETTKPDTPITGDDGRYIEFGGLLMLSIIVFGFLYWKNRRLST